MGKKAAAPKMRQQNLFAAFQRTAVAPAPHNEEVEEIEDVEEAGACAAAERVAEVATPSRPLRPDAASSSQLHFFPKFGAAAENSGLGTPATASQKTKRRRLLTDFFAFGHNDDSQGLEEVFGKKQKAPSAEDAALFELVTGKAKRERREQLERQEKAEEQSRRPAVRAGKSQRRLFAPAKKKKASADMKEEMRGNVRTLLQRTVSQGSDSAAADHGQNIEGALFAKLGSEWKEYKLQARALIFNLGLPDGTLRRRVLEGEILPAALVCLGPDDLASDELQAQRREQREKYFREEIHLTAGPPKRKQDLIKTAAGTLESKSHAAALEATSFDGTAPHASQVGGSAPVMNGGSALKDVGSEWLKLQRPSTAPALESDDSDSEDSSSSSSSSSASAAPAPRPKSSSAAPDHGRSAADVMQAGREVTAGGIEPGFCSTFVRLLQRALPVARSQGIEQELFRLAGADAEDYKRRARNLIFNLSQPDGHLLGRVREGEVCHDELVRLASEERTRGATPAGQRVVASKQKIASAHAQGGQQLQRAAAGAAAESSSDDDSSSESDSEV